MRVRLAIRSLNNARKSTGICGYFMRIRAFISVWMEHWAVPWGLEDENEHWHI